MLIQVVIKLLVHSFYGGFHLHFQFLLSAQYQEEKNKSKKYCQSDTYRWKRSSPQCGITYHAAAHV